MSALVINKDGKENEKGKNPLAANEEIEYVDYEDERMLDDIQILVSKDLSEPYSVFTYRYFVHNWPNLSICVYAKNKETNERKMNLVHKSNNYIEETYLDVIKKGANLTEK